MEIYNGFRKLQERLREQGWFVEWNMPCCQTCAWGELPWKHEVGAFKGKELDYSKVLFNHSQDCEVDEDWDECPGCKGEGYIEDTDEDCGRCDGEGYIGVEYTDFDVDDYDTSVSGFVCNSPEQQHSSTFCYDGDKQGVKNLKEILPIIEECGCKYSWSGKGDCRIDICW
jgi:hypothetical protein